MLDFLLELPRSSKRLIAVSIDIFCILSAYFAALCARYNNFDVLFNLHYWLLGLSVIVPTLLTFIYLGLYRAVLRYISIKICKSISIGAGFSTLFLLIIAYFLRIEIPRSSALLYFVFLVLTVVGIRLFIRSLLNVEKNRGHSVIIYGAGDAGRQLLTALNQMSGYLVVAFVDDNRSLQKISLHGLTVYSPNELPRLIEEHGVNKVLLAMPSTPLARRREIIESLSQLSCEVLSMPSLEDIVTGKAKISSLNKVSIEDLLGREPVAPIESLLSANIRDKVVMVTGAGGSIGSELCRQIIAQKPACLVLFEMSEFALYAIERELAAYGQNSIVPILGSVQDFTRLDQVIKAFQVQTIYHAAAYKHVPLVEYNVVEGVRNNIFGTLQCAKAAIANQVSTFVLISTDKAVRPTNTMGTTKRMAELVLQALAKENNQTRFCMVRFGNVLGSSGSVVPLFRQQIESGGPITLTHPDITRYFMTIPEASLLVIQAGSMGQGGDVFVLDMGEPVKIIDLARRMIQLSGLKVKNETHQQDDIEIKITGLRPGEKLYEELLIGDNVVPTSHPRIMSAHEKMLSWTELEPILNALEEACRKGEQIKIRNLLMQAPTSFQPVDNICDLLWEHSDK